MNGSHTSVSTYQEFDCSSLGLGGVCDDGQCVILNNDTNGTIKNVSCIDSDGGLNYTAYGNVTLLNGSSFSDSCRSRTSLKEWFCENGDPSDSSFTCSNLGANYSCEDGICVPYNYFWRTTTSFQNRNSCSGICGESGWTCSDSNCLAQDLNLGGRWTRVTGGGILFGTYGTTQVVSCSGSFSEYQNRTRCCCLKGNP